MQNGEVRGEEIPVSSRPSARFLKIEKSNQLQLLQLLAPLREDKISRLLYTNSGTAILVLLAYGVNLVWRWPRTDDKKPVAVTTKVYPVLWHPSSGLLMTNDMSGAKPEGAVLCLALATNDSYCISASGGKASLYSMSTAKLMESFADPPPAATSLAFLPGDNNVVVIGLDDSNILIYNVCFDKVENKLEGHSQRISALAFSLVHQVLVSAGADSQIIVWSYKTWDRLRSQHLRLQGGNTSPGIVNIELEFHRDQHHFLLVHERQLLIFAVLDLVCVRQCVVGESSALISGATFSCDGQLIYTSFKDGTVCILAASDFNLLCSIKPSAYCYMSDGSNLLSIHKATDIEQWAVCK